MNTNKELDRIVHDWLEDRVAEPPLGGLRDVLDRLPETPQVRRRYLGRWLDRGAGARRRSGEHGHPPDTNRRTRLMFSATGLIAAFAVLAIGIGVVDTTPQPPGAAGGATHVVATDGTGDFDTIGAAVAAAEDGDTVLVRPGTYTEAVTIDKDITVRGDAGDPAQVVVRIPDDGAREPIFHYELRYAFYLDEADATVGNLTVNGPSSGVSAYIVKGGSPTIHDSITSFDDEGFSPPRGFVYMDGGATGMIRDNVSDSFLWVDGGSAPEIAGNRPLAGDSLADAFTIRINGAGTAALIHDNEVDFVLVHGGSSPTVEDNTIDAAGLAGSGGLRRCGIDVAAHTEPTIRANRVQAQQVGICLLRASERVILERNTVAGNDVGIELSLGSTPLMVGNTVCDNTSNLRAASGIRTDRYHEANEICEDAPPE